jgi:hypothetical protein
MMAFLTNGLAMTTTPEVCNILRLHKIFVIARLARGNVKSLLFVDGKPKQPKNDLTAGA